MKTNHVKTCKDGPFKHGAPQTPEERRETALALWRGRHQLPDLDALVVELMLLAWLK
jgi:hypothetical protein